MATRTIVVVSDDLDGTESDDIETVRFVVNDKAYSIDLSGKNRTKMDKDFEKWISVAREERSEPRRRRRGSGLPRTTVSREHSQAMRDWLKANGHAVSTRGRIPQDLQDIFNAAHRGAKDLSAAS